MTAKLPIDQHLDRLAALKPSMRYDGSMPFAEWQKMARAKLYELLGMDKFTRVEPDLDIEYEHDCDDFTDIRFTFQSESDYRPLCNLLIPKGAKTPPPVAICLAGHHKGMHVMIGRTLYPGEEKDNLSYSCRRALQAIKEGYAVLTLEQRGFGERGGTPSGPACLQPAVTAMLIGRTLIGERVWDVSRAIDQLKASFPQVDSSRIACMGGSGGGTATFYTSCLEPRISVVNATASVCSYSESIAPVRHCMCNYIPRIAEYFDMGDLGGLIAPRPFIMDNGKADDIFRIKGSVETAERIKKLYRYAGAPDNYVFIAGEGGHQFFYEQVWPEFNRLSGWKK